MSLILRKNKENFVGIPGCTFTKFSAVMRQNQPWPCGLRLTSSPTASKRLNVAPLRPARFFLWIKQVSQRRNLELFPKQNLRLYTQL
jgi:hypothetical protein